MGELFSSLSYESVRNDVAEVVKIWWQYAGGVQPEEGFRAQILWPNMWSTSRRWLMYKEHQVCVKYKVRRGRKKTKWCHDVVTTEETGHRVEYLVSELTENYATHLP